MTGTGTDRFQSRHTAPGDHIPRNQYPASATVEQISSHTGDIAAEQIGLPIVSGGRPNDEAWMRDPNTVAAIVNALRQVYGDEIARISLNDGLSLAALIEVLLYSPLKNHDAIKLITRALSSGDFIVTPHFGPVWHLKYFYDRPRSLHVVDIAVMTLDQGTIPSTEIHLRLPNDN